MANNKTIAAKSSPVQTEDNHSVTTHADSLPGVGLWMEFEDSFIQVLAGIEPANFYYNHIETQQQQIVC